MHEQDLPSILSKYTLFSRFTTRLHFTLAYPRSSSIKSTRRLECWVLFSCV